MDLLASIRKEGSRGGRANFKWEDVQNDQHRENYLGHSLKAPVGRWQKNRDLGWYASSSSTPSEQASAAAEARKAEIKRIKEAEQDALSVALGFAPVVRRVEGGVSEEEVKRLVGESNEGDEGEGGKGVGFGGFAGVEKGEGRVEREVLGGEGGGAGGLSGGVERGGNGVRNEGGSGDEVGVERGREREDIDGLEGWIESIGVLGHGPGAGRGGVEGGTGTMMTATAEEVLIGIESGVGTGVDLLTVSVSGMMTDIIEMSESTNVEGDNRFLAKPAKRLLLA
ncbi:MAG: hypothetical protein M1836_004372 [Candelina mexicana]|nr:MAG: hypothetical protein M1836_004372 [Candelina mexicana]